MRLILLLIPALLTAGQRPNPKLTPGASFPWSKAHVCMVGYAKSVRNVPESEKRRVFAAYHVQPTRGRYEVDHLISLELGGSNDLKNLWPQSYLGSWNAHDKDRLENRLHKMVCHGDIDLKKAQKAISSDWIAAYRRYLP